MMRVLLFAVLGLAASERLNPITRVAQLLEDLAAKVEADGKAEQDLYDGFKCWCKKVINSKSASIEANTGRINELAAYLDDLTSGRVELTSERSTLEDDIKQLEKEIAEDTNMRKKENDDYLAAKDELDKSITALDGAVSTLGDATADMKEGVFLTSFHSQLKKVLKVGQGFMSDGSVARLQRVLDAPETDWNDLNKDATFKMKYKQRSGEIQDILAEMLQTFKDNRDEAVAAEEKAVADFTALMTSKNDQLSAARTALEDKSEENGARHESLSNVEAEKTNLETQNTDDERFISETKASCETKAQEWSARKQLREGEKAAIQSAIATLRSDDARDLFKRSFDSQSFLQTRVRVHPSRRHAASLSKAAQLVRKTAVKSGDLRLVAVASKVGNVDNPLDFTTVTKSIDDMVDKLKAEEKNDAKEKEMCESERAAGNKKVTMESKEIDTNTETIDRLTREIAAANTRITEILQEIDDLNKAQADADAQRQKEADEHAKAKTDDQQAVTVVGTATKVLEDFYKNNGLMLAQIDTTPAPAGEGVGTGGVAPTPPPSTWGDGDAAGYGGATGESAGIIQMLEAIKDDINKDIAKADADESDAIAAYDKLSSDISASISALNTQKGQLDGEVSSKEGLVTDEKKARRANEGDIAAKLEFLKSIAGGCDFMMKNFETRKSNRQAEMDGLAKAKAIFAGATFA